MNLMASKNSTAECDCLNFCGDDPWLEKGKSRPCENRILELHKKADEAAALLESRHPDNLAVDRFAEAMKAKLASARAKGRGGWDDPAQCTVEHLCNLLRMSLQKGKPVDLANYAMMVHQRSSAIVRPSLAKYIEAINAAPTNAQAVVVDGQPVFINRGTSEQDWIDMAEHQELEALITDVKFLAGELSLRMPNSAEVPQWVESGLTVTLLIQTRPAQMVQS